MVLDVDLNALPVESRQHEGDDYPIDMQHAHVDINGIPGLCTISSNADAIDDDVVFLSSSEWTPKAKNKSRKSPVTVDIDELEMNTGRSGVEEPATTLSLSSPRLHQTSSGKVILDCDTNANKNCISMMNSGVKPNPDASSAASAPPTTQALTCPVCICPISEPSTTICGHVFCHKCIETAISKNKKCPTCRRKLTKKSFHRIYLP